MRRLISLVSILVALAGLGIVLFNATTLDRRPPGIRGISLSAPAGDSRLAQTLTAIDIEFTEPVRTGTVEARFRIEPPVEGAFTWDRSTAIFTPSGKLAADASFTIVIAPGYTDLAGNADADGLDGWTFRTVGPPVVLRATPEDGAGGIPLDGVVELVFDRLMDTTSVESAIDVSPSATVSATWRGSVVTLGFGQTLRSGTSYVLTVSAEAADTGGSRLEAPFAVRFTTVGTGLGISGLIPADGAAGIGVASPIAVRFDAPIDPESAREALHVTPSADGDVRIVRLPSDQQPGTTSTLEAADTLLFEPSAPLAPHTTYTVTLDPTVKRLDDPSGVASGQTWSFTTGAPTVSGQNQIAFLGARGGIRNVWVMNPDGTNQRQLTVELAPVSSFDTSADGARVVFASAGIVTITQIDGTGVERLTPPDGRLEYAPAFTPDDSGVVVARRDPAGGDLGYWLVPRPGTPGEEHQILGRGAPEPGSAALGGDGIGDTEGTPPWMPRIAFEATGERVLIVTAMGEVALVALGPGRSAPIFFVAIRLVADAAPVWAPSRGAFLVAGTAPGNPGRALFAVDLQGRVTRIAGTDGAVGAAGLRPSGGLAILVRLPDGSTRLRLLSASGASRDLAAPVGRDDRWPAWSPDGKTLLIGRTLTAQPGSSDGIWLVDADTDAAEQLTRDGAFARWIP